MNLMSTSSVREAHVIVEENGSFAGIVKLKS